ncbi:MAG: hypothetical protein KDE20_17695, partial [Caldilineaceae bacterium]|nr:hypothetical protein [Caldilineaceae bacterium]
MSVRWLETDTISSVDISTAATPVGAYTADADRQIFAQFYISCAGNGDYIFWMTLQVGGSGSEYRIQPRTTAAVASGATAIAGQSTGVNVRSGDILRIYIDGLAGDTSVSGAVRWFELAALRPTVADRTLDVASTGEAGMDFDNRLDTNAILPSDTAGTPGGLATFGVNSVVAANVTYQNGETNTLPAVAAAILEDTGTTLPGLMAAELSNTSDSTASGAISRTRGNTWLIPATIGAITGYTSLWFTVKHSKDDADADAILQIKKNASETGDGLIYKNGSSDVTAGNGSITVSDASTGAIVIALDEADTDD